VKALDRPRDTETVHPLLQHAEQFTGHGQAERLLLDSLGARLAGELPRP
jgi:hypothetical protein